MRSLLGCCLLGLFLATGTCLECETCFQFGTNCTGIKKTCAAGEDTCIISLKQAFQSPTMTTISSKGCGPSSECHIGMREVDFGNNMRVRMDRVCCTGDACETVSNPVLPPPDLRPNGLQCPGCFGMFSTDCYPRPVACTGSSTKCIELAGQITLSIWSMDVALKGCATEATCFNLNAGLHNFGGASANLSMSKCTPAVRVSERVP